MLVKVNRDTATWWRWILLDNDYVVDFGYEMSEQEALLRGNNRLAEYNRQRGNNR